MTTPPELGSPIARAAHRLMRGDQAASLDYDPGTDQVERAVEVLAHLLFNQPKANLAYPAAGMNDAFDVSSRVLRALDRCGFDARRFADMDEVDVIVSYGPALGYWQAPVRIAFPFSGRYSGLRDLNLVILDASRVDTLADRWRMTAKKAQFLLLGSALRPEPRLKHVFRSRPTPWGEPPLELVLAGTPS